MKTATRRSYAICEKFDGARISQIEVSAERIDEAFERVDKKFIDVMRRAAENIRKFHLRQVRAGFMISDGPGVVMGQRVLPIEKVGLYVPGGTAALPSSLLMNCIPAQGSGLQPKYALSRLLRAAKCRTSYWPRPG